MARDTDMALAGTRIAMIGSPITHVQTPGLLKAMFRRDRVATRVVKRRVGLTTLGRHVAELRRDAGMLGLVVTTPLKDAICAHLDRRTALVRLVGSANCVRFDKGSWIGANFDGFGFLAALAEAGIDLAGKRVRLVGCGGAGKPIAAAIARARAATLIIDDTDAARVDHFIRRLRRAARGCEILSGPAPQRNCEILVNATPLGMRAGDPSPFSPALVRRSRAVIDIVIGHQPSQLQRCARRFGKTFVGGTPMVRGQAAFLRAFLTGTAPDEAAAAKAANSDHARAA